MSVSTVKCETCNQQFGKYRCPRCQIISCSLICVKQHKETKGCNGVRNKAAFVPLSAFGDLQLLNDYRYLEDLQRKLETSSRITKRSYQRSRNNFKLLTLRNEAKNRGIRLRTMPLEFSKRRRNRTYYNRTHNVIRWLVEWKFPASDACFTSIVDETKCLSDALNEIMVSSDSDPLRTHTLRHYTTRDKDQVKLFMKVEGRRVDYVRYCELDHRRSLRDNLYQRLIIEFPTIFVVLKEDWDKYQLEEKQDSHKVCDNGNRNSFVANDGQHSIKSDVVFSLTECQQGSKDPCDSLTAAYEDELPVESSIMR